MLLGSKRPSCGTENLDFKNAQGFQHNAAHAQGLGMMVGQQPQTSSQPHIPPYDLINTIQQQITHNNFVIPTQELPGAPPQASQHLHPGLVLRPNAAQPAGGHHEGFGYPADVQPLSERYSQNTSHNDLITQQ